MIPEKVVSGSSRKLLKVIGQFQGYFVYRTRQTNKSVFVVEALIISLDTYIEVIRLKSTTSWVIIRRSFIVNFSRHGLPKTVIIDNGLQYLSNEFDAFAKEYNFYHNTSSPEFSGQVEHAVQTVKRLLKCHIIMALLNYSSTPLPWFNFSPSRLLMGRSFWPLYQFTRSIYTSMALSRWISGAQWTV